MSDEPDITTKDDAIAYWEAQVSNGDGLWRFETARIVKVLRTHEAPAALQVFLKSAAALEPMAVAAIYRHAAEQLRALLAFRQLIRDTVC